jgi:hypothetical protein
VIPAERSRDCRLSTKNTILSFNPVRHRLSANLVVL